MDLSEFESRLAELIGRPTRLRPFVCDGSPLRCRAFLVGANPATALDRDFWSFWKPGHGFLKTQWMAYYADERVARGKRPASNTRRVIDRIVARSGVACLETNAFASPTATLAELAAQERVTDPLDFLLLAVQPDAIVTYGADAQRHVERSFGTMLRPRAFQDVDAPWGSVSVRAEPHFSRGYSYQAADDLAAELRAVAGK